MDKLYIRQINASVIHLSCEDWMAQEISDKFSFFLESSRFHPAYKSKMWDGKIRLLNVYTRTLPAGLLPSLLRHAEKMGYEVELDESVVTPTLVTDDEINGLIDKLKRKGLFPSFDIAPDQFDAIRQCFNRQRISLLSPTGSGKSFIIYLNLWHWKRKTLVIVPGIGLANQLKSDLISYGMPPEYLHVVAEGSEKTSKAPIVIATYQSIYNQKAAYFKQYKAVIGDELHRFKAKSMSAIMEKCTEADVRIGMTGSFDDSQAHEMVIKGHFGDKYRSATTAELQEAGRLSALSIKAIVLKYTKTMLAKLPKKATYPQEIDFITQSEERNKFITKLACSLKGTTVVFFRRTDSHGKIVYDMIKEKSKVPVFYIDGSVDGDERERLRLLIQNTPSCILVASLGTTSTGVNIPKIDNGIFATPVKSKITVLQSVGRGLRLSEGKEKMTLYDIADDLSLSGGKCFSMLHLEHRLGIYAKEQWYYTVNKVTLVDEQPTLPV